jgi:acyl-coenzyme A synthetase/AMP-(fatty) acid ligase
MALSPRTLLTTDARRRVAKHAGLGGGNVWHTAVELSPTPNLPALIADRPLINTVGCEQSDYSLAQLDELAQAWSAWYLDQGVGPRDRVIVYIEDSFEDQLQLAALAQIGAIPVLINGRMAADAALGLMYRTGPVGIYTDASHLALLDGRQRELSSVRWTRTRDDVGVLGNRSLPEAARFRHGDDDPVVICHSSGTTGDPKPVIWSHYQSLAGVRFRLSTHPEPLSSVMLSAVPQSHSSAIAFTSYAMLAGLPLIALSDPSGPGVARGAVAYEPTTILAFNQSFAELATMDLDPAAFMSVADWMNVGDSAHDAHIRSLVRLGQRNVDGKTVPGSNFGDGLGSSELGWAALRRVITPETLPSPRNLGKTVPIAEVVVLREDGSQAEVGEVGMLGVRSEAVAPGYWNDSDTNYRSRLRGYWLSGDLVYRNADNEFFHVDRIADAIHTARGDGYSLLMEEVLLLNLPEIADCAVVAGRDAGETVPVALVRPRGRDSDSADLLRRGNGALAEIGQPELALLEIATSEAVIPTGPTGKVLKRHLREKYHNLHDYASAQSARTAATSTLPISAA